jgi:hypothetical protein
MPTHKRFFLVVGGPGSGKTYFARLLQKSIGGYLIDDIRSLDELDLIPPEEIYVYITDPNFCLEEVRQKTEQVLKVRFLNCQIYWLFFENDPEQCRANVKLRNDGREVEPTIRRMSKFYTYPQDRLLIPVWRKGIDYERIISKFSKENCL